ncbi:MAG: PAS domain S-box protein, partial [Spirochaetia bacterium]|nr:PAS domain S-box protein [Spirochaetia bacterium]
LFFSQQRLYEIILWSAGSVLLVLLAVMAVWIFTLQRQIASRRNAEESLRESEEKFRMVFSTIHDTVSISRVDTGEIIDTNGKGLGYTREEAIGKTGLQLGVWGSLEDRKRMIEAMAKEGQLSDFEIEFHRKNGPNWTGSLSSSYIFIRGKKYLLTVVRDITEKKKADEQAQLQQARLQQANKMASLGILVAGVAHEINNPNSLIMLNTDLLQKIFAEIAPVLDLKLASDPDYQICGMPYAEIKPEIQRLLSGLTGASERILTTISGLKNFARVDNDKNKLEPVSLNAVVRSALTFTRNLILSSTQNFETELHPDLPVVLGNAHELEQVLINLITNACHAIKDKTEFLRIRTLIREDDVVVEVEDGGIGIPAESLSHLFDPFFTTERDRGGTGLGLSVAYSIVESHQGKLSFKSEPILGTCATLSLPRMHG